MRTGTRTSLRVLFADRTDARLPAAAAPPPRAFNPPSSRPRFAIAIPTPAAQSSATPHTGPRFHAGRRASETTAPSAAPAGVPPATAAMRAEERAPDRAMGGTVPDRPADAVMDGLLLLDASRRSATE